MTSLNFTVTQQSDEIKSLLDQIELDHTNTVFSSDQWFKYNCEDGRISFTNIDDNGIVQNALHIKTTRKLGFTIAELAGERYIQYNDAMNNTGQPIDEFLEKTIRHLKTNEFDALYLHNVRKDSHIYDYCQRHSTVIRQKQAPWINLTKFEGYNAFFDDCSSTIRKVYRKLHREYDTQFQVYLDDEILTELVQEIIDLKLKQLNQLGKSSRVFMKTENLIKLTQIFTTTTNDYQTFVSTVRCNGKLVSGALSMIKGIFITAISSPWTQNSVNSHQAMRMFNIM